MNPSQVKVIAFDVFGTVFNFAGVDRSEIVGYVKRTRIRPWVPLHLPKSWEAMPAHPDSVEGIAKLREKHFVVTCSNGPLGLLAKMSKHAGIDWDAIIPMELYRLYKPNPEAYLTVCKVLECEPSEVLMVTANESFGDLEAAESLGMQSVLIRGEEYPTILSLAEALR